MYHKLRQTRLGQNLVEFALIGPLFFVLIFGIIEGGRLVWTYHTVGNAAKEGARYATVRGSGSTQSDAPATNSSVKTFMLTKSPGLNASKLDVNLVLLNGDMNDRSQFRVEAAYDHDFIVASIFGLSSITLEAISSDIFWREPDN